MIERLLLIFVTRINLLKLHTNTLVFKSCPASRKSKVKVVSNQKPVRIDSLGIRLAIGERVTKSFMSTDTVDTHVYAGIQTDFVVFIVLGSDHTFPGRTTFRVPSSGCSRHAQRWGLHALPPRRMQSQPYTGWPAMSMGDGLGLFHGPSRWFRLDWNHPGTTLTRTDHQKARYLFGIES